MNENHARNELNRGVLAEQVLNNPIYQEAFIAFRAQLMEGFRGTKFKQNAERDEIWRKMQTVDFLEEYLQEVMETGKMAKESLSTLEKAGRLIGLK